MPTMINEKKWILYRHTNNLDIIKAVAVNLSTYTKAGISLEEKSMLNERLRELLYYKERNPDLPLDAINHKINTLAYFMFGHKSTVNGRKRFLFSPLGDLMIENFDNHLISSKIFLSQLFAIQFPHPHGGTDSEFSLYPYRLIFKLLRDPRLKYRLYSIEIATCLVFIKNIDETSFEILIKNILKLRMYNTDDWIKLLDSKKHAHVNSYYEWDYYQLKLFSSAGIIKIKEGEVIHKMNHGRNTVRTIRKTYFELTAEVVNFCDILLQKYSPYQKPLNLQDSTRLYSDVIKEVYSFYPSELLSEIGIETKDEIQNVIDLIKAINYHSENQEKDSPYEFERLLTKALNYFINIRAEWIGGAGKTDIECIFTDNNYKFCVDAKSTSKKTSSLNSGRLRLHREKIGAGYTLIITPGYVPSVISDIKNEPITILLTSTFSEYFYKIVKAKNIENDYAEIHNLILNNPGTDISELVSELTFEKFAS